MDGARVAEAHFGLRRMNVDVDEVRLDVDEQHNGRMAVEVERFRSSVCRMRQHTVLDQPAIDEEELIAAAAEAKTARDEAGGVDAVDGDVDFFQKRGGFVADDLG